MIPRRRWFDRKFTLRLPLEEFPEILERVRGTPSRVTDRVRLLESETLVRRPGDHWSIQEHVGHLLDLEPLWSGRLDDLLRDGRGLKAADLLNRKTEEARHNERRMADLLNEFRTARGRLVAKLDALNETEVRAEALHPRLNEPMNVVGLCFFVAEHDDHHLATISAQLRATAG